MIVIYHSADFDGIFCYRIAKWFMAEDATYIGWDHGQEPIVIDEPHELALVMDLPPTCVANFDKLENLVWIDHHRSAIEEFEKSHNLAGYRIDGVAACRLAWQWFTRWNADGEQPSNLPTKEEFVNRTVSESLAVRLAGEYDVWDHRDERAMPFQLGLKSRPVEELPWGDMLREHGHLAASELIAAGRTIHGYFKNENAVLMKDRGFLIEMDGLRFLAVNAGQRGSGIFESMDVPETGHDALMAFGYMNGQWTVSLYHAKHRTDLDLSRIAVKHGGGGHKGACGFRVQDINSILKPT